MNQKHHSAGGMMKASGPNSFFSGGFSAGHNAGQKGASTTDTPAITSGSDLPVYLRPRILELFRLFL